MIAALDAPFAVQKTNLYAKCHLVIAIQIHARAEINGCHLGNSRGSISPFERAWNNKERYDFAQINRFVFRPLFRW